jgi:hypothetical protein
MIVERTLRATSQRSLSPVREAIERRLPWRQLDHARGGRRQPVRRLDRGYFDLARLGNAAVLLPLASALLSAKSEHASPEGLAASLHRSGQSRSPQY